MFKNLHSVVYSVNDIQKAKEWYGRILDKEPISDSPILITFEIGGINLCLNSRRKKTDGTNTNSIAYWSVDDIESAYKRLIEYGAASHIDVSDHYDENYIIINLLKKTIPSNIYWI